MPRYAIRPAAAPDAAPLAAFGAAQFVAAYGHAGAPANVAAHVAATYAPAAVVRELADPTVVVLVAEDGAGLAGYALLRLGAEPPPAGTARIEALAGARAAAAPAEVGRFYVDARWQGRGLAAELMRAVLHAAATRGARLLWLTTWEEAVWARRFYAKQGFSEVGTAPFHLGDEEHRDVVMARPLPPAAA